VAIARMWGYHLLLSNDHRNSPLIPTLLEADPDDNRVLLAVRFQEAAEGSQDTLLSIAYYSPNEKIRTRAARLIKKYKHWDDATYHKWLDTQTGFRPTQISPRMQKNAAPPGAANL
jgi:hypothetical protein